MILEVRRFEHNKEPAGGSCPQLHTVVGIWRKLQPGINDPFTFLY